MRALIKKIRQLLKDRRFRKIWYRGISATAAVVVFITTYALVLPAITMETEAKCGIPAHQHTTECYEEQLICGQEESDGHHHTEDCYTVTKELTCEIPEHQHDESCFDEEGNLTCSQDEHSHSATCYEKHRELTCGLEESDGHHHDSSCYKQVLTCGLEAHIHSTECYKEDSKAVTASTSVQASEDSGTAVAATAASTSVPVEIDDSDNSSNESDTFTTSSDTFSDAMDISPDAADTSDKADIIDTNDTVETSEADSAEDMTDNVSAEQTSAFDESSPASPESDSEESNAESENALIAATTDVLPEPVEQENLSEGYVPTLDPINMERTLDKQTGFYYYHAEEGEDLPDTSAEITSWKKVDDNTKLAPTDLIRAYFAYTIPAGQLNETNQVARYRLPVNIHLTDDQIIAINQTVNGIAAAYVDQDTLQVTDTNNYNKYLGAEAIEGTRMPDETLVEGTQEYISAVVKAEDIYENTLNDEGNFVNYKGDIMPDQGEYLGQDLIFIFTSYSIEKNQNEYDSTGKPVHAGEPISGWFACDFNIDQIDWSEAPIASEEFSIDDSEAVTDNKRDESKKNSMSEEFSGQTAEVIFVREGQDAQGNKIDEISSKLTLVNRFKEEILENSDKFESDEITNKKVKDESLVPKDDTEGESARTNETTDEETVNSPVEADQIIMPAMSFNDSIKVSTGKPAGIDENAGSTLVDAAESLPEEAEVAVRVEADEGTFPAGTTMVVSTVDQSSYDALAETLVKTVESGDSSNPTASGSEEDDEHERVDSSKDKTSEQNIEKNNTNIKTYGFQAVDITFFDKDGNEIEPAKPVRVALTSTSVERERNKVEDSAIADPVVVHVDNDGKAEQMDLVSPEEVEPAKGRSEEELLEETGKEAETVDTVDESKKAAEIAEFTADSFSVYAIVYTVELYTNVITDSGETYRINVTYDETSGIPQDAELKVKEIKKGDNGYDNYFTEAVKAASANSDTHDDMNPAESANENAVDNTAAGEMGSADETVNGEADKRIDVDKTYARFFDIEILSDGKKIEPTGDVSVSIRLLDVPEINDRNIIRVVHFNEEDVEIIPYSTTNDEIENKDTTEDQDNKPANDNSNSTMEFNFTASSFSVYSVVSYTVDFHWEMNGKKYEFRLPGGGFVSFTQLMEILGVTEIDEPNDPEEKSADSHNAEEKQDATVLTLDSVQVSEATKKFVADVEKVEFSSPELLSVSKVAEEATVGRIKDKLGLKCEYSAELTEEDIAKINDTNVDEGDWALISLKPFDTEETLTISMRDGGVFTIIVTDSQASDPFGLLGNEYIITNDGKNRSLRWRISDDGTGVRTGNVTRMSDNVWKFEYDEDANDGAGGYYLCAINGEHIYYLNVTDGVITLTDKKVPLEGEEPQEGAKYATPLRIHYDEGKLRYTISASSNGIGSYLTFQDNDTITINSTTANSSNPNYKNNLLQFRNPENPDNLPATVGTWDIKSDGIKLSLFDYQGYVYKHYYQQGWNRLEGNCDSTIDQEWGSNVKNTWLREGDGINRDRSLLFTGTGMNDAEDFNNFTGESGTYYSGRSYQGIVENNAVKIVNGDGSITYYPRLTENNRKTISDQNEQGSLAYLFDDEDRTDRKRQGSNQGNFKSKTVYNGDGTGLEGLLRKDELGYYYYDSEQNYARLNADKDEILIYADTYKKGAGSTEVKTEKIGMFPFDDYNSSKTEEKTPSNRNNGYNHQFGMSISAKFVYPPNGIVPETGLPETFEFSGDDDVWVFIDGVLVLDLGGVHQPISGKIDFSQLNDTSKGVTITHFNTDGDEFTYQNNTLRSIQEAFTKAGKTFDNSPYSTHQIDFFYLERGGADSNCSIRFNLLFMKQMEIAKQLNGLTPVEREKYRNDTFKFETGVKHNDNGLKMHNNAESYWSNDANWRDKKDKDNKEFETYSTTNQAGTDPVNNYTIKKYQNGSAITGEVMSDGQFTLKDGESMTITHMPASDVFYAAEENQPLMRRYETPHAERNYKSSTDTTPQEEETVLHVANAKGGDKVQDWETRAYKASETDLLTFTNTLKEKNFTVRKIWEDSKDADEHDPVSFKLRATVDGEDYSKKINAQWTETTNKTKTTTTDVYDPSNDDLKYQLKKENGWEITFEHLPARTNEKNGGREIIYSVIEDPEPQTYTVIYNPPEKTNVQYLDLFKFWPDGNDMHDGTTVGNVERKNEVIKAYIRRNDGKYVTAALDDNGEYVYTGVVEVVNEEDIESATQFIITSDNRQKVLQTNLASYNLPEMFDYAGRVNNVPKSNADELPEPEEGEVPQTPTPYTYELVQLTDEDKDTKGLVMFTRPLEEASILNKKDQIYLEKEWFDSAGNPLEEDERPDSITYTIYQLVHEHEWAVYDKTTKQWDYTQKADGNGWYVVQEGKMVNGVWKDGLEMRKCRFGSCNHYTEERTQVFEPCQIHTYGEWIGEDPSCIEGAEQTRACQRCGMTETRHLEPLGHNYQLDESRSHAATCTDGGHNVYVCSRCGDEYEEETQALDHQWSEWTTSDKAMSRECQRCHEVETINLNECFPGTTDVYLVDWNNVWPKWNSSDDMNAKKPVTHSRIFKYNNKYYVIFKDNLEGVDRTNWGNGASTPREILNYVLEVKTPVKNADAIWGEYTAKTGIGGTGNNQIQRGSLVKDGDSYYVYISDQYGSGVSIKRPTADSNNNWYKVPAIDEGTNGANGTNGTNSLYSTNALRPASASGKTFSTSQKSALRSANDNNAEEEGNNQANEQEKPADGGARGQATNKDLTLSILLSNLHLTGLDVKNPNTGDKLVEFLPGQRLETKDDSDTLVENETNLWRTVVDVPLAKEGFEYRYYIVENVPSPGVELEGNKYEITYTGQSNGLIDEGVTRITNTLLRTGSLKITKKVTINNATVENHTEPSLADGVYTFTVTKKDDAEFEPQTVTITITNGETDTEEVTDLEPGIYIVKENPRENHTTLSMINNEQATSDQAEVEVEAGKVADTAPVVSFTNNLVNTSIRVIKVRKDTETPVPGAKFTLTRVDEAGRNISGNEAYSSGEQTVDSNGVLEFTGLWYGRYKLEETFIPDGYIKREGPYYITIDQNGTGTLDVLHEHTMICPETGNQYTIENEPGVALPYTGGPGTSKIYLIGFLMILFATGLILRKLQ